MRLSMTVRARGRRGIGLELHDLALEVEDFDEAGMPSPVWRWCGQLRCHRPLDGVEPFLGELAEDHVGIGVRAVDLVEGDHDRTPAALA